MTERRYSRDEVDAILSRAIEREHSRGELSHAELVSAAREVGISADSVEAAVAEVFTERQKKGELAEFRRQQWRGFLYHLIPYLLVNGMLVTLNVLTTHFPWALFPAAGWGIGLVLHFLSVIDRNPQRLEMYRRASGASQLEPTDGNETSALLPAAARRIANDPANASRGAARQERVVDAAGAAAVSEVDGSGVVDASRDSSRSR